MKKIFKKISIITLISLPLLSLAQNVPQENTEQSFIQSKNQASQRALEASSTKEASIKIFKDIFKESADKLQSRLENILKDKKTYPQVAEQVSAFKTNIKSAIEKSRPTSIKLSKSKQIVVKNILNKGLFKTLDTKITKLESADTKITQKISLLISSNIDASTTANLLTIAEQKLAIAKSAVLEVESQINTAISSQNGIGADAIRVSILDANNKIIDAVNAYRQTLDSMPESYISNVASSTTSEDTVATSSQIENASSTESESILDESTTQTTQTNLGAQDLNGQAFETQNSTEQATTTEQSQSDQNI